MNIRDRLQRAIEEIDEVNSALLNAIDAGEAITRALEIPFRPAPFQKVRKGWNNGGDVRHALRDAKHYIETLEAKIAKLEQENTP